jgi:predicted metalloprotease
MMRWSTGRRSENVEDRRGMRSGPAIGGVGTIVLLLLAWYFGVDPTPLLQQVQQDTVSQQTGPAPDVKNDPLADFVSVVLGDTEDTWRAEFARHGGRYEEPKLVLFSDMVSSACGRAESAMGPFYCPADRKVYIDLAFYRDLRQRFQAPGDFAQAYVIAHEVGHHVQNLLGVSDQVRQTQQRVSAAEANRQSVRLELQADCFAGVWANHADRARQILEEGDVDEALTAATAIGDDRLQRQTQGRVTPDSFTHGTSAQRMHWFKQGLESGSVDRCDTFGATQL